MKIGVEAKWLFNGPPSGRRVVDHLVRNLVDVSEDDEVHVFLDQRSRNEPPPGGIPADRCHYVWAGNNQLSNLLAVPRAADRAALDAVVYQNFVPPRATRHARVAFVYDAIFASRPDWFTLRERLYFAPLQFLASTADRVCTISETERARLVRLGYAAADRVDVVPLAVDDTFVPRESQCAASVSRVLEALGAPERFILYAGRINARKNVSTLVRAMAHLRAHDVALLIVGAPDDTAADLACVAADAGVADRVRLLGTRVDAELRVLYATAAVFCFPSLDEGFGLGPLEAMASGTPVVASNVPVLVETCGDGAVYVDSTDPVAIAAAIDGLLASPVRRADLREAGLQRAASFTWRAAAVRLLGSVRAAREQQRRP